MKIRIDNTIMVILNIQSKSIPEKIQVIKRNIQVTPKNNKEVTSRDPTTNI